jgi:PAS domain S-box-containing protein
MGKRTAELKKEIAEHKETEKALAASDAKFQDMYDNAPDMFLSVDALTARILQCNKTLATATGYGEDEIIGKLIFEMYHPDSLEVAKKVFESFKITGEVRDAELQLRRKDGSKIDVTLNVSAVRDKQGNILRSRAVWRDITDHKRAGRKLARAEQRYRSLVSILTSVVWVTDATGQFVKPQLMFEEFTGQPWEEHKGWGWANMIHPNDRERVKKLWADAVKNRTAYHADGRMMRANGEYCYFEAVATPILDDHGSFQQWVGTITDITEHKKIENEIAMLAKFPSENPNPVLRIAKDGKVLYSNQAGELLLRKWKSGIGKIVPKKWHNSIAKALASEKDVEEEEEVEGRVFSIAVASIKDAGYVNLYARDVTERKSAEEYLQQSYARLEEQSISLAQSEKMNAVGTLVAGTAHELNNPVMGILNFAEHCIKHTSKEDELYTVMEDIEHEARRCAEIVQNLLTFSHTGQDDRRAYQKGRLSEILDRVLKLLAYRIEEQEVSLTQHPAEDTPEIWMDSDGMQQVLLSLVTNSLDAMEDCEKKDLNVNIRDEGEFVKMTIVDSGCGIPPESIGSLFDPFFTTKPVGEGTGLGLSVSQGIVKAHHGRITCESEPGVGTQFIVLLPVERRKERTQ